MNLWSSNLPSCFWACQENIPEEIWQEAYARAFPLLGIPAKRIDMDEILSLTLGEGRFGPDHWQLGFPVKVYYVLKPFIPRWVIRKLRQAHSNHLLHTDGVWPIENHYVYFLWDVIRQVLILGNKDQLKIRYFWPKHNQFAFVITHDIETGQGQDYANAVADLEESLGFHSSFNFVPDRYKTNYSLMDDLRERGFEVGVHGLKHNGRLFASQRSFIRSSEQINHYLREWHAMGFRADLTIRQPEWMQALNVQYDLSFFDTDLFEPIPGGTMSIWPFQLGHFVELPYTLVQDHTLAFVLNETSPKIWLDKVNFIEKYHGMALINSHPDYLRDKRAWILYRDFLLNMKERGSFWQALPRDVAKWWSLRSTCDSKIWERDGEMAIVELLNSQQQINIKIAR